MKEKLQISQQELDALKESSIGKRLKWIIKKLGFTTKEFAETCNLSYRTLLQYANDQRKPGSENLKTIAETFNINLHWLITGQGYPFISVEGEKELEEKKREEEREYYEEKRKYYEEERGRGGELFCFLSSGSPPFKDLKEREKSVAEEEELESELSFIRRCAEEVLSLPKEKRFRKLVELISNRYGVDFFIALIVAYLKSMQPRKIENVYDIVKAIWEINTLLEQMKKELEK